jgi:glyoxylase-like metal-dependent hydrolase (beta-lactamase superfamily II)
MKMAMQQVSNNCFAVLCEKNRVCDANSGLINTHEDGDHVWGNQLFTGAEIIAHTSVPERMKHVANPEETQKLLHGVERFLWRASASSTTSRPATCRPRSWSADSA